MSHLKSQNYNAGFHPNRHYNFHQIPNFEQLYVELNSFQEFLGNHPDQISHTTVDVLMSVISSNRHAHQKQAFFLYRQTAEILISITGKVSGSLAGSIISGLQQFVLRCTGKKQRALSESLGLLPIKLKTTDHALHLDERVMEISFDALMLHFDGADHNTFRWHGRTLRFSCHQGLIGCLKFARNRMDIEHLATEIFWLKHLKCHTHGIQETGHVPELIISQDRSLFKIFRMPCQITGKAAGDDDIDLEAAVGIGFITIPEYYFYPNEIPVLEYDRNHIRTLFKKTASLLGDLVSKGIIHTALIPLFHNRVQQVRRQDNGFYLWEHGGRLDQWLASCRFPNFSESGLRDFEHLVMITGPSQIRHYIGEHLLGFILVIGSFFRHMAKDQKGYDSNGEPVDLRHLFDIDFFTLLLKDVTKAYWKALAGQDFVYFQIMFPHHFIQSVINVMGIDRDMEETLRVQDQNNMDNKQFYQFLVSRGLPEKEALTHKRGKEDIVFSSGPHLGGFNQPISIPELIEKLFCFSSICTSDCYLMENGLKQDSAGILPAENEGETIVFDQP